MSLGPVMLDIEGTSLSPADRDLLREPAVGGVILFTRNYESAEQIADLVAEMRALRSPPLLIAVDHEGGRVQRFRDKRDGPCAGEAIDALKSCLDAKCKGLGLDPQDERLNANGGAIALGHPLGCTGAKLTATLLHEMQRRDLEHGIVSMCIGGGMGAAAILRAVDAYAIQPDGVILEAVFDTLINTVRHRFRALQVPAFLSAELLVFWGGWQWGFDGFEHNPSDYAASVDCPTLLMHGERDPRVSPTEARRVFEAIPVTKEFVTFERSGHESYLSNHATRWRTAVERFIEST